MQPQQIVFTVEQINQLLNGLGDLPFKQAKGFIEFITQIAQSQLATQEATPTIEDAKDE